eukprot:CAMPEP_0201499300 /NCGR_PEP_ID=MMETSP0151_2-20130828/75370_1 /ASSEMBLY_ACC=CAM_ASM_000257 /TAXON_ID=200890 /ORGANISM="Paramoeba atlantica, Strain 621/1 / CCAP 1560/9" /LENGTH=51 /DNA_ID=CAMNT_0047891499 /DNA_START=148 /DNA_END=303 /DNA_ORIENTATION=+
MSILVGFVNFARMFSSERARRWAFLGDGLRASSASGLDEETDSTSRERGDS